MGTLALDIETASPFAEPDGANDTEYYEWLSVALAYVDDGPAGVRADGDERETAVLFRRGGWDDDHTADLFERLFEWCEARDVDRTLTYNGAWFDLTHLGNWAASLAASETLSGAPGRLADCLGRHVDVAPAAADRYAEELWEEQVVLPDWKAYQLAGIDNPRVWYDDYDFDEGYREGLGINESFVKGEHVGRVLGERYVAGVVAGIEETRTHRELERLLYDYSVSDVTDLFDLYRELGGDELDADYHYPIEAGGGSTQPSR
ncbi:hypothetical protein SAMN04487947_2635 [Halogeometricum rufum]|uniref:Uncharacterized protein n=1 Tax=Halogeometricum rufum TaxID=553469 RepID=A0A1I6HY03_9EURY|nr:hypothetical protein [Halogeometricum rufum]SFR59284.1 hypothetical protein SAMN04487947_2635 [Halogeometricum rufum]